MRRRKNKNDNFRLFHPDEHVFQIFVQPDGKALVVEYTVLTSTLNSLILVPLGNPLKVGGKVVEFDRTTGMPPTYRPDEVDGMFAEYLHRVEFFSPTRIYFPMSLRDLSAFISRLVHLVKLWRTVRRRARRLLRSQ